MRTVNTYYKSKEDLKLFLKKNKINDGRSILVQVFTGVIDRGYIENLIFNITGLLPGCKIIGSTTDGEIFGANVTTTETVLSFSVFEKSFLKISFVEYDQKSSIFQKAKNLADQIYQENTKVIIAFADGLTTNGEQFLHGLSQKYPEAVIAGGLSADNAVFHETFIFTNDQILRNGAVGVSIAGDIEVYTGYNFNWEPIGKELIVTSAQDNVVNRIDDRNAYDTYKYYLGDEVANRLPAIGIEFPLIFNKDGINIARAVTGVCSDGSLRFAGEIKVGERVRFGYGNSELILNSSTLIPNELLKFKPESTFIYSCMARRRFMNHLIEKELDPLSKINSISGFFTYAEFFTQKNSNAPKLLNQTMTVLSLKENSRDLDIDHLNINYKSNNEDLYTVSLKALSHLINVTSNELENINKDLQESIQREKRIISQQTKMIEAQAKMAQLGDMIGHIAHQWRQPLTTISTAITSIQVQKELNILKDDYFKKGVDSIVKNVVYLSDTIKVFRDFLKEDKRKKTTSIQSVIKMSVDLSSSMFKDYHIKVINNVNYESSYQVNIVSGELLQVIMNIFNNSKDAIIENNVKNPYVKIDCIKKDDRILISIEDNGKGIDENIIHNIFDLYFTTKGKINGTGLGLHMCKNMVQKHMQGDIFVKNTQDGCVFFIDLPLKD